MNRDDIIRMAREAKLPYYFRTGEVSNLDQLERFAALVAAAEREACAQVCETPGLGAKHQGDVYAAAIRARSTP